MAKQHIDTSSVSIVQLDACSRIEDLNKHTVFYLVESASEPGTEYKVIYNPVLKALECLPHTGKPCQASVNGRTCWHKRAALRSAELRRLALKAEQEALMHEFSAEIESDSRELVLDSCAPFTVEVDQTSSSLDGLKWEIAPSGRAVPMR